MTGDGSVRAYEFGEFPQERRCDPGVQESLDRRTLATLLEETADPCHTRYGELSAVERDALERLLARTAPSVPGAALRAIRMALESGDLLPAEKIRAGFERMKRARLASDEALVARYSPPMGRRSAGE